MELKTSPPASAGEVIGEVARIRAEAQPASARAASDPDKDLEDETPPSSWLLLLRQLADRLPRRQLTRSLWEAIWNDVKLERKTFECSKKVRNPETLEALLYVLDNIKNEGLRSDIISEMHTSTDPERRRFLAGIIGARFQKEELLDEALNLLKDPDPEVVKAALSGLLISRFENDQREEASRRLREVARQSGRADVRAAALGALSESFDPGDLKFLMAELAVERNPECRTGAIRAMSTFQFDDVDSGTDGVEAIRFLWKLAQDPLETPDARAWARYAVVNCERMKGIDQEEWDRMLAHLRIVD